MANLNLGRIIGAGVFTTTVESGKSVAISTISPSNVKPLVGDAIIFANGEIKIVTEVTSTTVTCSNAAVANIKGVKGDDGVDATHVWEGTVLKVTTASGTSQADLKGAKGDKGDKGDPFAIYKTYTSVAAMNADLANVPEGKFVMISTGNVEDEDNAKLYVRDASSFAYITDLSGAQGIKGETGDDGVSVTSIEQTATSTADDGNNVFTVTLSNGTKADFTVQNGSKGSKGDTGETGAKGDTPVLSLNENGELIVTYESYQPDGGDTQTYEVECACCGGTFTVAEEPVEGQYYYCPDCVPN